MSMTREQAREAIDKALTAVVMNELLPLDEILDAEEALSILAPEPRTEPPGVDEVGDEEMCWYWEKTCWYVTVGCDVREGMIGGEYWLPLSALPMPKGGA